MGNELPKRLGTIGQGNPRPVHLQKTTRKNLLCLQFCFNQMRIDGNRPATTVFPS